MVKHRRDKFSFFSGLTIISDPAFPTLQSRPSQRQVSEVWYARGKSGNTFVFVLSMIWEMHLFHVRNVHSNHLGTMKETLGEGLLPSI